MIDETRILKNLKEFSFPRLSGTKFEKISFNIAKQKVEDLNLTPKIQEFSFSTFYSRIYPKISLSLLSWLLVVIFLNIQPIFTIVNLFLIFILILILIILTRNPEKLKIGRQYHSQNLFVKISSQPKNKISDNNIFLFSHLDSKGQVFSIKIRIQLYYIWIFSFLLCLLINILNSFFFTEAILLLFVLAILILIINCMATVVIWLNITNNKSKGAIDNASGISCVLELLFYYSNPKNKLQNYDLWFVFTGAEESGTMGIRNFYKYIKDYDRNKTFIANFDSIANRINLWDHGLLNNKYIQSFRYILENKDIMSIEKTRRISIGIYSDGLFLSNKRFQGLGNGDKSSYNYVHSVNDDLDKINIKTLKKLCQFYTILFNEVDINLK
ncbi:MAG: M28 family peptidase [Candidatus Lokiarchaeota archaeon]|nr:M28 family peptidase [Candidatus Lokiarchaeota archaeon]